MARKYVIIHSTEVEDVNFEQVEETSQETLRYSLDGSQTFVSFQSVDTPDFLNGKTQYDHSEILTIMESDFWSPNEL